MNIISLNIWNGRLYSDLEKFIGQQFEDTDVFCLQEIFRAHNTSVTEDFLDTPEKIEKVLGSNHSFISDNNGLMICSKNTYEIKDHGVIQVFKHGDFKKNLLWVLLNHDEIDYLVGTVHGIWSKEGRGDTPERIRQSEIIKTVYDKYESNKILTGDFNLLPNTKSIDILEDNMINLIKRYDISNTRTSLKKHSNFDKEAENFADYIFVSPNIKVKSFNILPDVVSDHYPLRLEI